MLIQPTHLIALIDLVWGEDSGIGVLLEIEVLEIGPKWAHEVVFGNFRMEDPPGRLHKGS